MSRFTKLIQIILEALEDQVLEEEMSYLDIGHYPSKDSHNEEAWVLLNDDILTSTQAYKKFSDFSKYIDFKYAPDSLHDWAQNGGIKNPSVMGRIDHKRKKISINPKFHHKTKYAKRLLEMDYPNYTIYLFN